MNLKSVGRLRVQLVAGVLVALSGCATQKQLYDWGSYQPMVYESLKGSNMSPQEQIARLEGSARQTASSGRALPPGFNAQLGMLYLQAGQPQNAEIAFRAEETLFPESRPYMQFLLARLNQRVGVN